MKGVGFLFFRRVGSYGKYMYRAPKASGISRNSLVVQASAIVDVVGAN